MRICLISPVGVIGGAERVLLATIRGAADHIPGVQVSVILLADGPLRAACERLGGQVTVVPLPIGLAQQGEVRHAGSSRTYVLVDLGRSVLRQGPATLAFLAGFRSVLRRLDPDLIHTHGAKAHLLVMLARTRGVSVLWHLHDFLDGRPAQARLLRWAARLAGNTVGGLAVSDSVRRDAAAILPGLGVTTITNSVDTTHFAPDKGDGPTLDRLAKMAEAPAGTIRVGLVATYAHWKGQNVFLAALARLAGGSSPVRGYIVGGPIYTTGGSQFTPTALLAMAEKLGVSDRVGLVPHQPDPAPIYRSLDVVVHASTRPEPFGLTIAEAMACGCPVVVAAAGGAVELFTPEHDGLGYTPGDVESLAHAIARLAGDPELRHRLGANARSTAVERFSPNRFGRAIADTYAARVPTLRRPR